MIRVMRGSSPRQKLSTPPSLYIVDAVDVHVRYSGLLYMWACMRVLIVSKGWEALAANTPPTTPAMAIALLGESCGGSGQQQQSRNRCLSHSLLAGRQGCTARGKWRQPACDSCAWCAVCAVRAMRACVLHSIKWPGATGWLAG